MIELINLKPANLDTAVIVALMEGLFYAWVGLLLVCSWVLVGVGSQRSALLKQLVAHHRELLNLVGTTLDAAPPSEWKSDAKETLTALVHCQTDEVRDLLDTQGRSLLDRFLRYVGPAT